MISSKPANKRLALWLLCLAVGTASWPACAADWDLRGHLKTSALQQWFPPGSIFRAQNDATEFDATVDLRVMTSARSGRWTFNADYQLNATQLDTEQVLPSASTSFTSGVLTDRSRLFDLTSTVRDSKNLRAVQRLDRVWIGYTTETTVIRAGRQALSWGNGFFFSPMDIVNPFDPAAVDTEYKNGDDMLYLQRLLPTGNDIEAAWVFRRDPVSGATDANAATIALRYNAISGDREYQLMVADSYDSATLAAGGSFAHGGTVWRADLVMSKAADWTAQFVANVSYSWQWRGKNVSGVVEYYFNGFGLSGKDYTVADVVASADLALRLARGETYTSGRQYLAAGATIEATPLWLLSPSAFINLRDGSSLLQLASRYSLGENLDVLAALTVPLGNEGRELRGLRLAPASAFLSRDAALFAQIAWYF